MRAELAGAEGRRRAGGGLSDPAWSTACIHACMHAALTPHIFTWCLFVMVGRPRLHGRRAATARLQHDKPSQRAWLRSTIPSVHVLLACASTCINAAAVQLFAPCANQLAQRAKERIRRGSARPLAGVPVPRLGRNVCLNASCLQVAWGQGCVVNRRAAWPRHRLAQPKGWRRGQGRKRQHGTQACSTFGLQTNAARSAPCRCAWPAQTAADHTR